MKKLEGKVALVTGDTSGIGLATAKLFVSEGASVVITGRRSDVLDAALEEIGEGATSIQADAGKLAEAPIPPSIQALTQSGTGIVRMWLPLPTR